ncbi:hypothetical protein J25TS5_28220 [Paenibacillus faecis]|nr:hypothetical protein J25TS5_28220 [Paenibacillus faecis]
MEINGERIYFPDEEPNVDKAQRVQVPVRFVSEALGAKVGWNSGTKTVTVELGTDKVVLVLDQKTYDVNGEQKRMDTAAARVGGRVFVPLRFVSEGLGASVKWDSAVSTVYISTSGFVDVREKPKDDQKDQVVEESINGFKVKYNTGSNLGISPGSRIEKGRAFLILSIRFAMEGSDYNMQVQEVEDILKQKVEEKTVNEIMKYVKTKTKEEQELKMKTFTDKNYEINVGSNINSNIVLNLYMK